MDFRRISLIFGVLGFMMILTTGLVLASDNPIDFKGTIETDGISQTRNSDFLLGPESLTEMPTMGYLINFRGDFSFIPSDPLAVRLRLSYLDDTVNQSVPQDQNKQFSLSRAYIDFSPGSFYSLRLGKQRLGWGTGYGWNPSNILDKPRNAFVNTDDPEGVFAIRSDLNLAGVTSQIVLTPQKDWESSGKAIRFKASPANVDLSLGWVKNGTESSAYIGDFAYSLSGVGLHGEFMTQPDGNPRSDKKDAFSYLVGADYNFPGGYYLALEYYHNDKQFKDIDDVLGYIMNPATTPADVSGFILDCFNQGGAIRDHIFLRGAKSFGDSINLELMLVLNPNDSSWIGRPRFEYIWNQNSTFFVEYMLVEGASVRCESNLLAIKNQLTAGIKVSL